MEIGNNSIKAPIFAIDRLRMGTDGHGVTTLVCFMGCPLHYAYCLDNIYFQATGGGICFGGGEPILYADFITEFRKLCGDAWKITIIKQIEE